MIKTTIIRSERKTLCFQINENGLTVKAPLEMTDDEINSFIEKKRSWIEKSALKFEEFQKRTEDVSKLSNEEIRILADKALSYIPERVKFYAGKIGVTYGKITIRMQKTRWGSCSANGNLNFNCLLMLTPDEVIDSVVVHELCHRKQLNHTKKFYDEIYAVMPDYDTRHMWLKKNGDLIMKRAEF